MPYMDRNESELLCELSDPDAGVLESMKKIDGDVMLLGAGGKIGYGLALMAKRAMDEADLSHRVIAVSRFSTPDVQEMMDADGISTIACDLTDPDAIATLPDCPNILYMVGTKFGTSDNPGATWLLNVHVPALVAQRYSESRIVAYSSGNIYPFSPIDSDGPKEDTPPDPVGEYGQTVLGRERIFDYFSRQNGTPTCIVRLNYANEPRYGVLVDIATRVMNGEPVDVTMGYVNVVWQTDCNHVTLRCFDLVDSPPAILNLAGPEKLSVRDIAEKFGEHFGVEPTLTGQEAQTALLSDGNRCWANFGSPQAELDYMIERIAGWLMAGYQTWNKATHFEVRHGQF